MFLYFKTSTLRPEIWQAFCNLEGLMSHINNNGPKTKMTHPFEPLNNRKTQNSVGQTYGERREKTSPQSGESPGWIQSIKDRFWGRKNLKNLEAFSNQGDRYEGPRKPHLSHQDIVQRKNQIENGQGHKVARSLDPYIDSLDSTIAFLNKAGK